MFPFLQTDRKHLTRCVRIGELANGKTGDNPRVGAVLVHGKRIIGEGYHVRAGTAHAEVNCLASVRPADRPLIRSATLYVSLEPCCITGRTGACTDVIRQHGITTVVFGQRDATPGVAGRSVEILREAGVTVREYPDFEPTRRINAPRRVMTVHNRPYVTLKYARSRDGFLRPADRSREYWLTGPISRRLVHRWRADYAAILVGGRTVVEDDPSLTTRLFPGPNPRPVIWDPRDRVSGRERLFRGEIKPLLFAGSARPGLNADVTVVGDQLSEAAGAQVLSKVLEQGLGTLLVEGGAGMLSFFLQTGLWDEARLFTAPVSLGGGLPAPQPEVPAEQWRIRSVGNDELAEVSNPTPASLPAL